MRYLISFLLFFGSIGNAWGQDYIIPQKWASDFRKITFDMVDATDGYTAETGLTPTCTIKVPGASAYASCIGTPTEIGTGTYQIALNGREIQNLGQGSLYITGTGARPVRIKFTMIGDGSMWKEHASFLESHSNYNNTSWWGKTGVTVTEDSTSDYIGNTIGDTLTGDGASTTHKAQISIAKPEGSGLYYYTTEVKSGTLNNAWVGDCNYAVGMDFNTSTGAVVQSGASGYLRGYKIDKLASSWWRIHMLYSVGQTDTTALAPCVALGNGTATGAQSFATTGTMIFARTHWVRAEDVSIGLVEAINPYLQSASSSNSVTLDGNETTSTDFMANREICFQYGYTASVYWKVQKTCSCISAYSGSTKVATLDPPLSTTLNNTYQYKIGGACPITKKAYVTGILTGAISASSIAANAIGATAFAADAITSAKIADNAIGASEIATDAIGADEIATNAIGTNEFAQAAADKVWNTAPEDGSSSTALGYLDAIKKYVANKLAISGSNYTVYKDDQTTTFATGTSNSAGRDPD